MPLWTHVETGVCHRSEASLIDVACVGDCHVHLKQRCHMSKRCFCTRRMQKNDVFEVASCE